MKKAKKICLGILYWILSLTWGILMTFIGLLVTGFVIIFLHGKPHRNGWSYIVEIGHNWGGLELGAVALCARYSTNFPRSFDNVRKHEFGHSIQNIIWGPFFPFVIGIPSAIRYWYREYLYKHHKPITTDYDSIWFEGQATRWGTKIVDWIESDTITINADDHIIIDTDDILKFNHIKAGHSIKNEANEILGQVVDVNQSDNGVQINVKLNDAGKRLIKEMKEEVVECNVMSSFSDDEEE